MRIPAHYLQFSLANVTCLDIVEDVVDVLLQSLL